MPPTRRSARLKRRASEPAGRPAKRARIEEDSDAEDGSSEGGSGGDPGSGDSDSDIDSDIPFLIDDTGVIGNAVQIPTPGVWQIMRDAVAAGARSVDAIHEALGGRCMNVQPQFLLHDFFIECGLACMVPQVAPKMGDAIRIMGPDRAWSDARVTFVGAADVKASIDGVPVGLGSTQWWYPYSAHAPSAQDMFSDEEPATGPAAGPPSSGTPLSLTFPIPDAAALARAARIRLLPVEQRWPEITKRVGLEGAIGNRTARRAVLAVDELQTNDEREKGESVHRNGIGWSKFDAPIASALVAKISSGQLLTPHEAQTCRKFADRYAKRVAESRHLAAILGNDSDDAPLADAHDDYVESDEEEDDEEEEDDDPIPDPVPDPKQFYTGEETDAAFYRHDSARFLSPGLYREIAAIGSRDAQVIFDAISQGYMGITLYDVHIALAQTGDPPSAVGQTAIGPTADDKGRRYFAKSTVKLIRPRYTFLEWEDGEASEMSNFVRTWAYVA